MVVGILRLRLSFALGREDQSSLRMTLLSQGDIRFVRKMILGQSAPYYIWPIP
jgi:hypothetical protein